MNISDFVSELGTTRLLNVFNPYRDKCLNFDGANAPSRRRTGLAALLEAAAMADTNAIWIGRDLGYRGGRRTGLALTDDVHLSNHAIRWNVELPRATIGEPVAERTAAVIWRLLDLIDSRIFLWNVFPFHPHEPDDQFTNRAHSSHERRIGEEFLVQLIDILRPSHLIALGNDACASAGRVAGDIPITAVRHPSYGGQAVFDRQIRDFYGHSLRRDRLL